MKKNIFAFFGILIFTLLLSGCDFFNNVNTTTEKISTTISNQENTTLGETTDTTDEVTTDIVTTEITYKQPFISISDLEVTTSSLSFIVNYEYDEINLKIQSISLVLEDEIVAVASSENVNFLGLLSDTEYSIEVSYQYTVGDEDIAGIEIFNVSTLKLNSPTISGLASGITTDSFFVSLSIDDQDSITTILTIELYDGDTLLQTIDDLTSTLSFEGLLSNHEYFLVVNYQYDLNDGSDAIVDSYNLTIKTLANAVPTIDTTTKNITFDGFEYIVTMMDTDLVGQLTEINLYDGTTIIETITEFNSPIEFSNLLSNHQYQVDLTYQYDLKDGHGIQYKTITCNVTTLAKTNPQPMLETENIDEYGFEVTAYLNDSDLVGQLTKLEVWIDDNLLQTQTDFSESLTMDQLQSDTDYTITLYYSYNLNDGEGTHEETFTITISTLAIAEPIPQIIVSSISTTGFDLSITFNDSYEVGELNLFSIYDGETLILTESDFSSGFVYSDLLSNHQYRLVLDYAFDLNDGEGVQNKQISKDVTTNALITPEVIIEITDVDSTSIVFELNINDPDELCNIQSIELWQAQTLVESLSDLSLREFTNLTNPLNNTIVIVFSYNLNDGNGLRENTSSVELATLTTQEFEINYHLDGGVNNDLNPSTFNYDDGNFLLYNPSRVGAKFLGWYDNPDLSGSVVSYITQGTLGDLDLYAKWELETYDVNYYIFDDYFYDTEIFFTLFAKNAQGYNATLTLYDDGTYYLQYEVYYGILEENGNWFWENFNFSVVQENDNVFYGTINSTSNTISIYYSIIDNSSSNVTFNISYSMWQDAWGDTGNYAPVINTVDDSLPLAGQETITSLSTDGDNVSIITNDNRIISWGETSVSGIWGTDISDNLYIPTDITDMFNLSQGETIIKTVVGYQIYILTSEYRVLHTYLARDESTGDYYLDVKELTEITLNLGEVIIDISYGEHLTRTYIAILTNQGRMFMCGNNDYGQLGTGTSGSSDWIDITNNFGLESTETIIGISIGGGRSSAWTSSGRFFIWGDDGYDDLMDLATSGSNLPIDATSTLNLDEGESILQVSVTNFHFLILTSNNRLLACGYGGGHLPHDISELMDLNSSETIAYISSGINYSGALTNEGRLLVWEGIPASSTTNTTWYTEATLSFDLDEDEVVKNISIGANQYARAYIAVTNKDRLFMWGRSESILGVTGTFDLTSFIQGDIVSPSLIFTEEVEYNSSVIGYTAIIDNPDAYTFYGWFSDPECENEYTYGALTEEGLNLYGYFHPKSYWIEYHLDGGIKVDNISNYTIETETFTLLEPTKDGYTFGGWYDNESFNGEAITEIAGGTYGNIHLYAKWTVNQYAMTFETYGGNEIDEITLDAGANVTAPTNPIKQGYTFSGWYTDPYYISAYSFSTMPAQDIMLYAKWEPNVYILTYVFNNGDLDQTTADYAEAPFVPVTPTYSGYIFSGWYLDEDLTILFTLDTFPTENTTLYAKWIPE